MVKEKRKTPKIFKLLRENKKLSLEDVGKLLGMSRQYVHMAESGVVSNPFAYANKFAKKMKLNKKEKDSLRNSLLTDYKSMIEF